MCAFVNGGRIREKGGSRATNPGMVRAAGVVGVVLCGAPGFLWGGALLAGAFVFSPAVIAGVLLGNRLHASVQAAVVVRVVYLLLVVAGVSLLVRAAAS